MAAIVSIILAVYFWTKENPPLKQKVVDDLMDLAIRADSLIKEQVSDLTDLIFYQAHIKQWIEDADSLIKNEMNDEEHYMLKTMHPMIMGDENADVCRLGIMNRSEKLRHIAGRYFRGENRK